MAQKKTEGKKEEKKEVCLSLVIPAYNVEPYVHRCLGSIFSAGCRDLEVMIVLGHSADGTNAACRSHAGVTCIMQDKTGLSNARNCGIRAAQGKYVAFLDADDFVLPDQFAAFCRFLAGLSAERDFDVLANDFYFADTDGTVVRESCQIQAPQAGLLDGACAVRLVRSRGTFWNAWRYVYKRSYLLENKRAFAEGRTCEDLEFAVRTMLSGADIVFCHMPYYAYCPMRPGSLMNGRDWKMVQDFLITEQEMLRLCRQVMHAAQGGRVRYPAQGKQARHPAWEMYPAQGKQARHPAWAMHPAQGKQARHPVWIIQTAAGIQEKLKELLILCLPDIWELPGKDRKKAVQGYQKLFLDNGPPHDAVIRIVFLLCRTKFIKPAGRVLCIMKYLRRRIRYRHAFAPVGNKVFRIYWRSRVSQAVSDRREKC